MGLTVVALGTSAPEGTVSVGVSLGGQPEMALGNVLGSNLLTLFAVLGLSALVAPNGGPPPRRSRGSTSRS